LSPVTHWSSSAYLVDSLPSSISLAQIFQEFAIYLDLSWLVLNVRFKLINARRYNSAVFEALSANEYDILVVTEDFLSGASWDHSLPAATYLNKLTKFAGPNPGSTIPKATTQRLQDKNSLLERLDNVECMNAYNNRLLTGRRSVLAVTSAASANGSSVLGFTMSSPGKYQDPLGWVCAFLLEPNPTFGFLDCDLGPVIKSANSWKVLDQPIEYCLSEVVDEHCKLQFSKTVMIVVILCNLLKACCMLYAAFRQQEESLVTTG